MAQRWIPDSEYEESRKLTGAYFHVSGTTCIITYDRTESAAESAVADYLAGDVAFEEDDPAMRSGPACSGTGAPSPAAIARTSRPVCALIVPTSRRERIDRERLRLPLSARLLRRDRYPESADATSKVTSAPTYARTVM